MALGKFWITKRTPQFVYECMECLGGGGYVEESPMPRYFRESPLNAIWEGSGNVIALDILRTFQKEPSALEAYFAELAPARGEHPCFDRSFDYLSARLRKGRAGSEARAYRGDDGACPASRAAFPAWLAGGRLTGSAMCG